MLDVLHELPDSVGCAALIGHNPTVAAVAGLLDGGPGDGFDDFPPCSLAIVEFSGGWSGLAAGAGSVVSR